MNDGAMSPSAGRWSRVVLAAGAAGLAIAAAGCPRDGGRRGARAADGLSVAIYTGEEAAAPVAGQPSAQPAGQPAPVTQPPVRRSVALVDDRRTIEIEEGGLLRLSDVAEGIELASLIVEPLDGRDLVVESCAREGVLRGAIANRVATYTTDDGSQITGTLRDASSDGKVTTWVVEDADGRAHFIRGEPEGARVAGGAAMEVRCQVAAAAGPRRVRLAYATDDLSWQASYRVNVDVGADGAAVTTVQPTFTIAGTGVIGARHASVALLVGLPGGEVAPRQAWSGEVDLGSDEVSVQPARRELSARFEHVYRGALAHRDDNPRVGYWRSSSTFDVWVSLGIGKDEAIAHADLPAGPALVWVTRAGQTRQADVRWPEPDLERPRGFDVPLWPSPDLIGYRERRVLWEDGQRVVEQFLFSVSNQGELPATVWVEEELRPAAQRDIRKPWPGKPQRRGDLLRFEVDIAPRKIERVGFEAEYRW